MITTPESLAVIMDCYPNGLIGADANRWNNPAQVDDAAVRLVEARAEELKLSAAAMYAYVWRQPDDARRAEACARLPAGMADDVMASLERGHAP